MRRFAVVAGLTCALLFPLAGLAVRIQTWGDGSIFSYAVAVADAWDFHWRNIAARSAVYILTMKPAELYVTATHDADGAIFLYGFFFLGAQAFGLAATFALDHAPGRIVFVFACASTALFCPLVFGAPSEMWIAHALFWPALALAHDTRGGVPRSALLFALLLALAFAHEGGVVLLAVVLLTLIPRGFSDRTALRAVLLALPVLAAWIYVKRAFPPDAYDAPIFERAGERFFAPFILTEGIVPLYLAAVVACLGLYALVRRVTEAARWLAPLLVALALGVWWLGLDHALHAEFRYYLRTILLAGAAGLGLLAGGLVVHGEGAARHGAPLLRAVAGLAARKPMMQALAASFAIVLLIHAVETAKFLTAFSRYTYALRTLAMSDLSDPALGDPGFVSVERLGPALNRLTWNSTTPYLSVLVAPGYAPHRLVVFPTTNYFWIDCARARTSERNAPSISPRGRALVTRYACLHRR